MPMLNEAANIEAALKVLAPYRKRGVEIIAIDGGSGDGTAELARPLADRVLAAPRGRAAQMNAGAAIATGDVLLFLHADTRLPEGAPARVARALAELAGDGYVESRQGCGTFVIDQPPTRGGRAALSLEHLVEGVLDRARRLGFSHEELLATIAASAPQGRSPRPARWPVLLVECNQPELSHYRQQLEEELPVRVDRLLVGEFQARLAENPQCLQGYRVIVTTFFHIHEVKQALPAGAPPVLALLSAANISTLLHLTELPENTTVGLVCNTRTGSENLLSSVRSAGLSHLVPVIAWADDPWSIDRMLEKTRTVVCSEQAMDRVRERLPLDVELILCHRRLDEGGIEMLRDLLFQAEGDGHVH